MISTQQKVPGADTGNAPAATTNGKNYILAWTKGDQTIWWTTCPASASQSSYDWATPKQIPNAASSAGPALANLNGTVWIAWKGEGSDTRVFLSSLSGSTWSPGVPVAEIFTSSSPALTVTASTMVLAWKGSDNSINWSQSSDGKTWNPQGTVPGASTAAFGPGETPSLPLSSDTPAVTGFNGVVYFAWKGVSDNRLWWTSVNLGVLAESVAEPAVASEPWGVASVISTSFQTDAGPALGFGDSGVLHLVWKGASDNTIWTATFGATGTWSTQTQILVVATATRPALASQVSADTDILLTWKGAADDSLWASPLDALAAVQAYLFDIPSFHISMMRTGHAGLKDGSDTDYVSMGVKVRGQPASVLTRPVGDQTGGNVDVGLFTIPPVFVSETDEVYFHYSVINSSAGSSGATQILENVASTIFTALEKADEAAIKDFTGLDLSGLTPQQAGALLGAQLGNFVLPGLGTVLGALAGWFADSIESLVFPNCDGPVALGVFVFSAAKLRQLTQNGVYVQTDEHAGLTSASGCGQNSDYQVTWNLTNGSVAT